MPALRDVIGKYQNEILADWVRAQSLAVRRELISEDDLRQECHKFLSVLRSSLQNGGAADLESPDWVAMRELLASISRSRALQGFSPTETAVFVLSLKEPLFARMRRDDGGDPAARVEQTLHGSALLDQ